MTGETLRARLRRETQLPVSDALRIAADVADALDYAHRQGVVHRDIEPENILLPEGQAVLADFGIALAADAAADARLTETGVSLGTPYYMSPEQAAGDRNLSARSDIYALGAVVYEMLVGEPPFTGPTRQVVFTETARTSWRSRSARIHPSPESHSGCSGETTISCRTTTGTSGPMDGSSW
jgi:serine/threonine-protein kinase